MQSAATRSASARTAAIAESRVSPYAITPGMDSIFYCERVHRFFMSVIVPESSCRVLKRCNGGNICLIQSVSKTMTLTQEGEQTREQIRLWPGIVAVTLQWIIRFGVPLVAPDAIAFALIGGLVGALAVLIWWAFFSRVPPLERWGALAFMVLAVAATPRILHPSIVGGMMGMMFRIFVIPGLCLALVVWAAISRRLAVWPGRAALVAVILIACGAWALVRTDGITGNGHSQFAWRWKKTHEQQLLAEALADPGSPPPPPPAPPLT